MDSVTKFFYDRGWHGINIEPLPYRCALLAELRPRDINLCVGLGSKDDKIKIFESDGLSTFLPDIANRVNITSKPQRLKRILTLSEVYEKYCDPKQEVHFCKIDVEGFEKEVLEGISDWKKFRPWIFAIEATIPLTDTPCHDKWEYILSENDYVFAFNYGVNRYYVDLEKEYLLKGFSEINSFIANNEVVVLRVAQRITMK